MQTSLTQIIACCLQLNFSFNVLASVFCHLQHFNTSSDENLGEAPRSKPGNEGMFGPGLFHVSISHFVREERGLIWVWLGLACMYATKLFRLQQPFHAHPFMRNRLLLAEANRLDLRVLGGHYLPPSPPWPH